MAEDSIDSLTSIDERWVKVEEDSIPYLAAGDSGPEIVMVHGGGGTRWEWAESMTVLAPKHRVVAPDLIGFGGSPRRDIVHTTGYLSDFLVAFLESTGKNRVTLVGHSLGARVILEVALHNPEVVEGLLLIAPLGFGDLTLAGRLLSTGTWWVNRLLRRRQPFPQLEVHLTEPDMNAFSGIKCESLLIWGSRDPYFPQSHSDRALRAIPNSSLYVYEGAGHAAHRSHVRRFTSDVRCFIQRRS